VSATVIATYRAAGFHRWPDASPARRYLADRHRHLFHVRAELAVEHDDREVEIHDLIDACRAEFDGGELGPQSCETIARRVLAAVLARWPGRAAMVEVLEDGEAGARVAAGPGLHGGGGGG
jgi:hypothetical protein